MLVGSLLPAQLLDLGAEGIFRLANRDFVDAFGVLLDLASAARLQAVALEGHHKVRTNRSGRGGARTSRIREEGGKGKARRKTKTRLGARMRTRQRLPWHASCDTRCTRSVSQFPAPSCAWRHRKLPALAAPRTKTPRRRPRLPSPICGIWASGRDALFPRPRSWLRKSTRTAGEDCRVWRGGPRP